MRSCSEHCSARRIGIIDANTTGVTNAAITMSCMPGLNTTNPLEILKRVAIFADLSPAELQFLAERAVAREYGPGELVFSEDEACEGLFVVESGRLRIFKSSPSGREQVLSIEGPGSSVAELPVFDGGNYPASTAAVEPARLLFVSK